MNLQSSLVIQTALRPMTVFTPSGEVYTVEDFPEFFATMSHIEITKDTQIYINRGPGSYSGIRTGIAYVYGLFHGGLISKEQIHAFTSFDLVRAGSGNSGAVFLKSWPRLANGTLIDSRGYFDDADVQSFIQIAELKLDPNTTVYSEEDIKAEFAYKYVTSEILRKPDTYKWLIASLAEKTDHSLEPLYINPVHTN